MNNSEHISQNIENEINSNDVMLFMKGTPVFPMCGFSARVVEILNKVGVKFGSVNVLESDEMREGIKIYSNWPTIPQLYVKKEFIGGCDIITEMFESGELLELFNTNGIDVNPSRLLNNKFSKGVIFSCIAAIFWGLPQPLFFNELNHVETIEVVAHRGFWSFIFLFLLLILISNISDFIEIFKSRKRIFILTITAFLIAGNWAGFIYSVGQERVQDASMGYFITPMISIVLGYFFLNEKITKPKFASVCFMLSGILFLFINLNQFPFLIIWIGTSWAIYGLLRKQVNVNPPIGLLYETFIISLISTPYLVYLFWQNENSIFSIDLKTSLFLILTGAVTIFPLLFFNLGLKFIQLGLAGVLFYLAPTFHFITSVFILNEEILQIKLISFIIIWIGIIIYIYDSYKKEIILNNTQ